MQLDGLTILVTRPDPKGLELCRYLSQQGANAIHFPTIAFAAPERPDVFNEALSALGQQDYLLFISPQAVYASIVAIRRQWPQLPPTLTMVAVGGGTAAALKKAGYIAELVPEQEWSTEGLLELPAFQAIKGKKVAIVKGDGGRTDLSETLMARGAEVLFLNAYRRVLPPESGQATWAAIENQLLDAIICTSFEGVKNLKQLFGAERWTMIQSAPLIVMSERIKLLAADLGFQTIWVASITSEEATLEALLQKKDEICRIKKMRLS